MEEVQIILNDCEEFVKLELELESKTNTQLFLEFDKQAFYVTVCNGHALIGNIFGDNTNLTYNNKKLIENSKNNKRRLSLSAKTQRGSKKNKLDQTSGELVNEPELIRLDQSSN